MKILAIETSCDETAIALVDAKGGIKQPRFKIEQNLVASQIKIHQPFGGVVPNLAKREHLKNLPVLYKQLTTNNKQLNPDLIAVTVGPGLEPALWTGVNFAKELKKKCKKPLIGVNHLEGHLYSNILKNIRINKRGNFFPAIALVISGGHTSLLLMKDLIHYKKLGETRDDAVGESFDKVARLLNLPYPGGPEIEKIAKKGDSSSIEFPRPMIRQKNYDFSFSGLKTAVLYYLRGQNADQRRTERGTTQNFISANPRRNPRAPRSELRSAIRGESADAADIAASFQEAAFDVLITKALKATKEFKAKSIMVSGGVAANKTLQSNFKKRIKIAFTDQHGFKRGLTQMIPKLVVTDFPTDNAVMIASAAYINYLQKKNRKITAQANLNL